MKPRPVDDDVLPRELRISAWSLRPGGRTGDYLGDGVLTSRDFVLLHPRAARKTMKAGPPARVRIVVDTPWACYVTNGSVMTPDEGVPKHLIAVELDWPITEEPTPMPVDPSGDDVAELLTWLDDAEGAAPTDTPQAPKRAGYTRKPLPVQVAANGGKPWWCRVWPKCKGC